MILREFVGSHWPCELAELLDTMRRCMSRALIFAYGNSGVMLALLDIM